MSYEVKVTREATEDLRDLARRDRDAAAAAIRLTLDLRKDAYLGKKLRDRPGVGGLADCRAIAFDRPNWKKRPRYRLVYLNEPHDGAPHVIAVLAVGERKKLAAYRAAVKRRLRRSRRLGIDRGRFHVPDDFDEPLSDDLLAMFNS